MKKYVFGLLLAVMIIPQTSSAYEMLEANEVKFSDSTVMFTIKYQLGFGKYGLEAPVGALRGGENDSPYLSYSVLDADGEVVEGGTDGALVFSPAAYRDARYLVSKNDSSIFTLVAFYTAPEGVSVEGYSLQVDSLPFVLIDGEERVSNGLSVGELKSYTTKEESAN